ncbi:MAG: flagellar basal body L-ring protein FlgH [Planctomycetota bacterium]|jgi:flagellar L-ring protein precursor FlgH
MTRPARIHVLVAGPAVAASIAAAQTVQVTDAPSSSLMVDVVAQQATNVSPDAPHALQAVSLFAVSAPEPRDFQVHDLVEIVVRESSQAVSTQELELDKEYEIEGVVAAWPHLRLEDLLQLQLFAGRDDDLPELAVGMNKEFEGEGEYERTDDLVARLTAEVLDILPNGNLILEARTHIAVDREESTIKVTGICRQEDVTFANTILSSQLHDLRIEKIHEGELRNTNEKGIVSRVLDVIFAF